MPPIQVVLHWQSIELQGARIISYVRLFLSLHTKIFSIRIKAKRIKDPSIFNEMYSDIYLTAQNDEVKQMNNNS